jgi:hypothetical protein
VFSADEGDHWQSLQRNLPVASVRDIIVKGDDLAVATHGRGFWILDNFTPLRQAVTEFYKPATAIRMHSDAFQGTPLPPETPQAPNPPDGAVLDYELKSATAVTLEILDGAGKLIRKYPGTQAPARRRGADTVAPYWNVPQAELRGAAGLNRFVWDLRYEGGPLVLPARYTARLSVGAQVYTQTIDVVMDPRSTASASDLAAQLDVALRAYEGLKKARAENRATAITYLNSALEVAESADRMPPAVAYTLLEMGLQELTAARPAK